MRIEQLTESTGDIFEQIFATEFFQTNIKPNLEKGYTGGYLIHGSKKLEASAVPKVLKVNRRKGPTDNSMVIHQAINDVAEEKIGVPVRSLLFTSKSEVVTEEYGTPFIVIPSDGYQMYYSLEVADLYSNRGNIFSDDAYYNSRNEFITSLLQGKKFSDTNKFIAESLGVLRVLLKIKRHVISTEVPNIENDYESLEELRDSENLNRARNSVYKKLIGVVHERYGMEEVEEAERSNEIHTRLMGLADYMVTMILDHDVKWLQENAHAYVNDLRTTKKVSETLIDHEIMLDAEKVFIASLEEGKAMIENEYKKRYMG